MADPFVFALTDVRDVRKRIRGYFDSLSRTEFVRVWNPEIPNGEKMGDWDQKEVPAAPHPAGMAGLAVALGVSRRTIQYWMERTGHQDEGVAAIAFEIVRAMTEIEARQEALIFNRETGRGAEFSLTHNFKWGADGTGGPGTGHQTNILPPPTRDETQAIAKWEPKDGEE